MQVLVCFEGGQAAPASWGSAPPAPPLRSARASRFPPGIPINNEPPKGGACPRKGFALSAAPQLLSHPLRGSTGKEIGIFCEPAFSDSLLFKAAVCFQFLYCVLFLFQKERPGGIPPAGIGTNTVTYHAFPV